MKASIILAHPYDKSFNHAISKKITNVFKEYNITPYFHDLYKDHFSPVLTTEELGNL